MLNIKQLLEEVRESPYEEVPVKSPHTGIIRFESLDHGQVVEGAEDDSKGSLLGHLEREGNVKPVSAPLGGELVRIAGDLDGGFIQAGETLAVIRHYLSKDEVIERILKKTLSLFHAPERAAYYFVPEIENKIKASGSKSVVIRPGQDVFIASRMKRESLLSYDGPGGIIHSVYFHTGEVLEIGAPLIGVCGEENLVHIQEVVGKVQAEWEDVS